MEAGFLLGRPRFNSSFCLLAGVPVPVVLNSTPRSFYSKLNCLKLVGFLIRCLICNIFFVSLLVVHNYNNWTHRNHENKIMFSCNQTSTSVRFLRTVLNNFDLMSTIYKTVDREKLSSIC